MKKHKHQNQDKPNKNKFFLFDNKLFLVLSLLILSLTFFNIYNKVFDKKIDLNGDNVYYYILGKSIASGQGFTNIHLKDHSPHNHFTPGYPFIIATSIKMFSDDISTIKRVNGFFFLLSLFLLYFIVLKITGNYYIPFIVSLFALLNVHLLSYSFLMMSEIPFLLFSLLSLWLFMKTNFSLPLRKNYWFFILILSLSATYYIRTIGIALVGAILFVLLIKRNWKYIIALISGFVLLALPWFIRSQQLGGNAYMKQLLRKNVYRPELGDMSLSDFPLRIWENFSRYITREIPSGLLNFIKTANPKTEIVAHEWFVGVLLAALIIFGILQLKKYRLLIASYIIFSFGILFLWPSVWFGVRFLIPMIPILLFLLINGIVELALIILRRINKTIKPGLVYAIFALIGVVYAPNFAEKPIEKLKSKSKGHFSANYQDYFDVAKWVNRNTPDTTVVCCRKGELFNLYSERYVTNYKYTLDTHDQLDYLIKKSTDYVVLDALGYSSTIRYLYPAIQQYPAKFQLVLHKKKSGTYLFRFRPDLGYFGEWKDNKRNGKGTFLWENGIVYEGMWTDGLRNGAGKMAFPDGTVLIGTWKNDKLEGEAKVMSKNGEIIERRVYKDNEVVKVIK